MNLTQALNIADRESKALSGFLPINSHALKVLAAEVRRLIGENHALRELMNCYNVGGWTDSLTLIKERNALLEEVRQLQKIEAAAQEDHKQMLDSLWGCVSVIERTKHCTEEDRLKTANAARAVIAKATAEVRKYQRTDI